VNLDELENCAVEAIEKRNALGLPGGEARIFLKLPGKWGRRQYARLGGRCGGPLGRIVADIEPVMSTGRPQVLVDFDAVETVVWVGKCRARLGSQNVRPVSQDQPEANQ
jgi:hypothetical protein